MILLSGARSLARSFHAYTLAAAAAVAATAAILPSGRPSERRKEGSEEEESYRGSCGDHATDELAALCAKELVIVDKRRRRLLSASASRLSGEVEQVRHHC